LRVLTPEYTTGLSASAVTVLYHVGSRRQVPGKARANESRESAQTDRVIRSVRWLLAVPEKDRGRPTRSPRKRCDERGEPRVKEIHQNLPFLSEPPSLGLKDPGRCAGSRDQDFGVSRGQGRHDSAVSEPFGYFKSKDSLKAQQTTRNAISTRLRRLTSLKRRIA